MIAGFSFRALVMRFIFIGVALLYDISILNFYQNRNKIRFNKSSIKLPGTRVRRQ